MRFFLKLDLVILCIAQKFRSPLNGFVILLELRASALNVWNVIWGFIEEIEEGQVQLLCFERLGNSTVFTETFSRLHRNILTL